MQDDPRHMFLEEVAFDLPNALSLEGGACGASTSGSPNSGFQGSEHDMTRIRVPVRFKERGPQECLVAVVLALWGWGR